MDSNSERTEDQPRKVRIGEWFHPEFAVSKSMPNHLEQFQRINIEGAGEINVRLMYDQEVIESARDLGFGLPVLFVMPQGEREITTDDMDYIQKLTETRATSITVISPENPLDILHFTVELMLPSERVLTKNLIGPDVSNLRWTDPHSKRNYEGVVLPDTDIKNQIKLRIVNKES